MERPGARHTIWYKVAPVATKCGTLYVGRRAAENALHAVRYAGEAGRPMNTHVTINFTTLGIDDDAAGTLFRDLQARVSRWWRDQRVRKGRDIGALLGFHTHANPAGSRHVHWLTHVPAEIAGDFAATVQKRLRKLAGRDDLGDALDIRPVGGPGGVAKYILRGIDPAYAGYLHIEPAHEGLVAGCRRSGVSKAAGRSARKAAGWVRRKRARR